MTHSLHRKGSIDELRDDYIVFAISSQEVNAEGSAKKFKEFYDIITKFDFKNLGDMKTGNKYSVGLSEIENNFADNSIVHVVFTKRTEVVKALKKLKEKDLGLSIVVSGLIEDVKKSCEESGADFHTVNNSLGIWGNTDRLPENKEVIKISTMCGHGMVSFSLVQDLANKVKNNRMELDKAVEEITKQCHCGIINPVRTKKLLKQLI